MQGAMYKMLATEAIRLYTAWQIVQAKAKRLKAKTIHSNKAMAWLAYYDSVELEDNASDDWLNLARQSLDL